jgi:hypothetical protein
VVAAKRDATMQYPHRQEYPETMTPVMRRGPKQAPIPQQPCIQFTIRIEKRCAVKLLRLASIAPPPKPPANPIATVTIKWELHAKPATTKVIKAQLPMSSHPIPRNLESLEASELDRR